MLKDCPAQIVPALALTVGWLITVTVLTAVFDEGQPRELVPVTEYDVLLSGLTVNVPPVTV